MNDFEHGDLLKKLDSLNLDVPPMPEGFHEGWTRRLEGEPQVKTKPNKTTLIRVLSVAAALVFIVGGASLARRRGGVMSAGQVATARNSDSGAVIMRTAEYEYEDSVEENGVAADYSMTMAEAPAERMLVRMASLTISTQTYDESLAALMAHCRAADGWTASSSEHTSGVGLRTCYLTLRVPAEQLDAFLSGTAELGEVTYRSESAQDVTENYQDLRGRLATQQALMDRLQALVPGAASLSELLELEVQIAETQYQIDRLQSQLNSTEQRVNYATVDVTLREEGEEGAGGSARKWFKDIFQSVGETFVESLENTIIFLAAALPFIVIVAVVWLIARMIRRRKRR